MTESTMHVHLPALPDPAIFKDPERTIMTADREALLSYDPATRSGFIYSIPQQRWTISAPVDFTLFAALVSMAGYALTESRDTQRWITACMGNAAHTAMH